MEELLHIQGLRGAHNRQDWAKAASFRQSHSLCVWVGGLQGPVGPLGSLDFTAAHIRRRLWKVDHIRDPGGQKLVLI